MIKLIYKIKREGLPMNMKELIKINKYYTIYQNSKNKPKK